MQDYAATSGGLYLETAPDGTGTAAAIDPDHPELRRKLRRRCARYRRELRRRQRSGPATAATCYCRRSPACPVLPPDSCLASLESCTMPDTSPALTVPVCTWAVIGTGDGCDCGCGFPDPDCEGGGCTEPRLHRPRVRRVHGCVRPVGPLPVRAHAARRHQWRCPTRHRRTRRRPSGSCSPSWWGSGDVCDCFCGSPDPDCGSTETSGGVVCEPFCGNGHCDTEEFPSTCPEDCAPPPPFTGYPTACGL